MKEQILKEKNSEGLKREIKIKTNKEREKEKRRAKGRIGIFEDCSAAAGLCEKRGNEEARRACPRPPSQIFPLLAGPASY